MRCFDCEFRNLCDKAETVLTAFVSCEKSGSPMTDEAVDMVMERLEALKDGKGD